MAAGDPDRIAAITTTTRAAPTAADRVTLARPVALAPDVALVVAEHGDGCLVDLNGSFFAVSPVAAAMLRDTIDQGRDAAILRSAARYGVDATRIAADLDALIADMTRRGLLRPRQSRARSGMRGGLARAVAGTAALALRLARAPRSRAWIALTLARTSFLLLGWNATVGAWRGRFGVSGEAPADARRAIDEAVRSVAARHVMNVDCKERALACFALARAAGLPATLVVGVDFYPLAGHSWCEIADAVIGDEEAHCRRFTPAFRLS